MSPPNAVGYVIDEKSLWWSSFDVVVKCDTPTYIGHAKVEVCTDKEKPYLIHGCALSSEEQSEPRAGQRFLISCSQKNISS